MNSLPRPSPALCADTDPPCSSTRLRTMVSPRPRPPCATGRASAPAARTCSNTRSIMSGAIPAPSSRTLTSTCPPLARGANGDRRPGSLYLAAFVSRLKTTCARRSGSALDGESAPRHPFDADPVRALLEQRARHLHRRAGPRRRSPCVRRRSSILPRVIRDTSSRSSTRRVRCADLPLERRPARATSAPRSRISWIAVKIGASGLRSSWPSMARNSSLARFADSASRLASCSRTRSRSRSTAALRRTCPMVSCAPTCARSCWAVKGFTM